MRYIKTYESFSTNEEFLGGLFNKIKTAFANWKNEKLKKAGEKLAQAIEENKDNPEDDKKVLCLMVNQDTINKGIDIPFIKTLFKTSIHYQEQLMKRSDLLFINSRTGETLDYFDCDY